MRDGSSRLAYASSSRTASSTSNATRRAGEMRSSPLAGLRADLARRDACAGGRRRPAHRATSRRDPRRATSRPRTSRCVPAGCTRTQLERLRRRCRRAVAGRRAAARPVRAARRRMPRRSVEHLQPLRRRASCTRRARASRRGTGCAPRRPAPSSRAAPSSMPSLGAKRGLALLRGRARPCRRRSRRRPRRAGRPRRSASSSSSRPAVGIAVRSSSERMANTSPASSSGTSRNTDAPGRGVARDERVLHGRGAAPRRQQREVQVDPAVARRATAAARGPGRRTRRSRRGRVRARRRAPSPRRRVAPPR